MALLSFSITGYSNPLSLVKIDDHAIAEVEEFVRTDLIYLMQSQSQEDTSFDEGKKIQFFGSYINNPEQFEFQSREKALIVHIRNQINYMCDTENLEDAMSRLNLISKSDDNSKCTDNDVMIGTAQAEPPQTLTHKILNTFLETANSNSQTEKGGYRYSDDTQKFATFFRIVAGPIAYETIQRNMSHAFPSINSVNRYIHKTSRRVTEGVLRCNELLLYIQDRNLPLAVALAEDSTNIENYIQYDPQNNICVGFALPIDGFTGMPIPLTFRARSAEEIVGHFLDTPTASVVTTVMAKPIADNVAPFCILVFGSDNTNTAIEISKRWNYIIGKLKELNIIVLSFSSDSDPKYNSAMRMNSLLGVESNIFGDVEWFSCGESAEPPFYVQDTPHVATKGRNRLLITAAKPTKLKFGEQFFVQVGHLHQLRQQFGKDKHRLTATILNPKDRQNYDSALKICSAEVVDMLKLNVPNSDGTVMYLKLLRNFIDSFMDTELLPIERVRKLWYSIFVIRIWRMYLRNESLSVTDCSLTLYCYVCLELNAHSMVKILLFLRSQNVPELFKPWVYNSQSCESFYRLIRSLTTVFARAANCSVKEILERIHKIQLLEDISNDSNTAFTFPRRLQSNNQSNTETVVLPTQNEIFQMIEKSKTEAIRDAKEIGLLDTNDENTELKCDVLPLSSEKRTRKTKKIRKIRSGRSNPKRSRTIKKLNQKKISLVDFSYKLSDLVTISLKNYSYKFADKDVDELSSYVEIFGCENTMIVKKSSLIWFMRKDPCKLSSDRLERVRSTQNTVKKKKTMTVKHFS